MRRTIGAKGSGVAEELDGLELAAEFQLQHVGDREVIARGKSQRLQGGVMQVRVGRREAAYGQSERRRGAVSQTTGICGAQHACWEGAAVTDVAAEGEMSVGKDRALESEPGAHVRAGTVTAGG